MNDHTFVLIPGAWMGGWSWHPTARLLREQGHRVLALTLPGLSYGDSPAGLRLSAAVDHVVREVERHDLHDVVMVSHSWGGYPATGAIRQLSHRIALTVYYNAVVPAAGQSMADENPQYGQMIQALTAAHPEGAVPLPFEAVSTGLMSGEALELQRLVFELALPQPGGYMLDALPDGPVHGIPSAYLLGEQDTALARPGAEFASRLGVEPILIPGGHMTLLTHPVLVAETLLGVVSRAFSV